MVDSSSSEVMQTAVRKRNYMRKDPKSMKQAEERGLIQNRTWSQEAIMLLLVEYEKQRILYDPLEPHYRNRTERWLALTAIARSLWPARPKTTAMEIKLKFNILRTQYQSELMKEKRSADDGKYYRSSLWFMDYIKFLNPTTPRPELQGAPMAHSGCNALLPCEPALEAHYDLQDQCSEEYLEERSYNFYEGDGNATARESSAYQLGAGDDDRPFSYVDAKREIVADNTLDDTQGTKYQEMKSQEEDDDRTNSSSMISDNRSTAVATTRRRRMRERVQSSTDNGRRITEVTEISDEDLFGQMVSKKLKKIANAKKRAAIESKIYNLLQGALMEELDD